MSSASEQGPVVEQTSAVDQARALLLVGNPAEAEKILSGLDADAPDVCVERAWARALSYAVPQDVARELPPAKLLQDADSLVRIRHDMLQGVLANRSGEPDTALSLLYQAKQEADALGDAGVLIDVWLELAAVAIWTGRGNDAYLHLSDAMAEVTVLGDAPRTFLVLTKFGDLHLELQRHERALQFLERARQYEQDHIGGYFWKRIHLIHARAELGAGEHEAALTRSDAFLSDHGASSPAYFSFLAHRTRTFALIRLGRIDESEAALEALRDDAAASGGDYEKNEVQMAEAEYFLATGQHEQAKAMLQTMLPRYETSENAVPAIEVRLMLAEAHAGLNEFGKSTSVLTSGIAYADTRDLNAQVQKLRTAQTRLGIHDSVPEENDRHFSETMEGSAGAYVLIRRVGDGGFGTVYRALDVERNREVAIKRFRLSNLYSHEKRESIIASIKSELDATAELSHPGIARTIACGRDSSGEYYVVQEFVAGRNMRELMEDGGIEPELALLVMRDTALAVEALHAVGVHHRDIKPDNILLRGGRQPVLVDFGIATRVSDRANAPIAGTRAYMPPEALIGWSDRGRADVFALAVVLLEVLGGSLPADEAGVSLRGAYNRQRALLASVDALNLTTPYDLAAIKQLLRAAIRYRLFGSYMSAAEFAGRIGRLMETPSS